MDSALQTLLSFPFLSACLAVIAVVSVIKVIVNYGFSLKKLDPLKNNLWQNLILPILPVLLGSGLSLVKSYPFPAEITTNGAKFVFGLSAGLLSGLVWRVIKSMLSAKISSVAVDKLPDVAVADAETEPVESTPPAK